MEYNLINIGNRIRYERKKVLHKSQEAFCEELGMSRNTLVDIEHGRRLPQTDTLNLMSKLFQCEVGYILCQYDTKYYLTTDLQKQTGLSEEAIANIQKLHAIPRKKSLISHLPIEKNNFDYLNDILSSERLCDLLSSIKSYKEKGGKSITDEDTRANMQAMISRTFLNIIDK